MTNTIKVSDVSVEKAIQKGLRQLGLPQDQVFVEVISEGKKGLFGFGQKNAEVELTPVSTVSTVVSSTASASTTGSTTSSTASSLTIVATGVNSTSAFF